MNYSKIKYHVQKLASSKMVLYVLTGIAFLNIIGYVVLGHIQSLLLFICLSIIASLYTKNMILILLIPIVVVNLLNSSLLIKEGLETQKKKKNGKQKESMKTKDKDPEIDYAKTVENAYDQLNDIIGSDGIKNLTSDTQNLMKQQMQLTKSMDNIKPMMEGMNNLLDKAKKMFPSSLNK
jgi:hypothetical protein